jgi:hypothetical protein
MGTAYGCQQVREGSQIVLACISGPGDGIGSGEWIATRQRPGRQFGCD